MTHAAGRDRRSTEPAFHAGILFRTCVRQLHFDFHVADVLPYFFVRLLVFHVVDVYIFLCSLFVFHVGRASGFHVVPFTCLSTCWRTSHYFFVHLFVFSRWAHLVSRCSFICPFTLGQCAPIFLCSSICLSRCWRISELLRPKFSFYWRCCLISSLRRCLTSLLVLFCSS